MGDLGLNVTVVTFGLHSYADTSDCIVSFLTSPHRSPCTIRSCISLVCDVISSLVRVRYNLLVLHVRYQSQSHRYYDT